MKLDLDEVFDLSNSAHDAEMDVLSEVNALEGLLKNDEARIVLEHLRKKVLMAQELSFQCRSLLEDVAFCQK